jgi:hypothetical protein
MYALPCTLPSIREGTEPKAPPCRFGDEQIMHQARNQLFHIYYVTGRKTRRRYQHTSSLFVPISFARRSRELRGNYGQGRYPSGGSMARLCR